MEQCKNGNNATLKGIVNSIPKFSHDIYGEKFYTFELAVKRKSNVYDHLPAVFSERIRGACSVKIGSAVSIEGQFRSYNNPHSEGNRLLLLVFAQRIDDVDEHPLQFHNVISLDGFLCKPAVYRKTPFGREICDLLMAVNRSYNKTDYIPCIAWGRNAKYSSDFKVGARLGAQGRIQSREYSKKTPEGDDEKRTAYEVSIAKITRLDMGE